MEFLNNPDFHFWYTLILIGLMSLFLFLEWLEAEIIVFSVLILLVVGNVITIKEAFTGFSNEGMLTVALLFIIAGALNETGVLNRIAFSIMGTRKGGIRGKLARLIFPVAGISAFMNNTPVVAVLIPAVRSWAEKSDFSVSRFFIPLSYAAILGGMCTLIGTSTNLIVYGLMLDAGMQGMGLFEISMVGVPIAIVGLLYLVFVGQKLLPDRQEPMVTLGENTREFVIVLKVTEEYQNIGKTIEGAGLRHLKGLFLFQVEREGKLIAPAAPDETILLNDRLFFTGLPKTILELQKTPGLRLIKESMFDLKQYDASEIRPYETVISPSSPLVGKNVRESNFREKYNAVIIAIHRNGIRIKKKIGDIVLHPGDTLLLLAGKNFRNLWYHSKDFHLISETEKIPSKPRKHIIISLATLVAMLLLVVLKITTILVAAGIGVMILLLTRTISPYEAEKSIDKKVIAIIAAAFGIAEALKKSGLADAMAQVIISTGSEMGLFGVMAGIFIVTSIYTNIMTNNATAAIIFPVAYAAGQQMGVDPRAFVITLAIAASASFATPISYQTNLMVYGPGGYRFRDFLRIGLPLQIVSGILAIYLIYLVYLQGM